MWQKYDCFVYPDPGKIRGLFTFGNRVDDRMVFFKEYFPKWSGFHIDSHDCNLTAIKAVEQLDNLVQDISCVQTFRDYPRENKISYEELKLSEVSMTCM